MMVKRYLFVGIALLFLVLLYVTFLKKNNPATEQITPDAYQKQMVDARRKKDNFYRTSTDSPITDKNRFTGLTYFDPSLTYRVTARLEPFADKTQKLIVRLSDGSEEVYEKYAHAVFSLDKTVCRLLIVRHEGTLSVLFKDATSGHETYGGGRYIDLEPETIADNRVVLDFNAAYNPYCAYAPDYACPLPPAENVLPVAVKAGETYKGH